MSANNHCYCCGNTNLADRYHGLLIHCPNCGHTIASRRFFDSDFSELYSEKYFKGEEYLDYLHDRPAIQKNFDIRLKKFSQRLNGAQPESVIEIGAAYGFFGDSLRHCFPGATYTGFEISKEPSLWAQKELLLDVRNDDYLQCPMPENSLSDVFMWDVIEHVPDPSRFIRKAANELKSEGRIHITTGDISRLLPRIQGRRWRMIHPPTHLHYFSRKSLTTLLQNNGFRVVHTSYPPVYRSIRQIVYSLLHRSAKKSCSRQRSGSGCFVGINTFDILYLIAEKK